MKDYTETWQLQDAITTAVNANGYTVWDLHPTNCGFQLETDVHLEDEAVGDLCSQLPLTADYAGEGSRGTIISLYRD